MKVQVNHTVLEDNCKIVADLISGQRVGMQLYRNTAIDDLLRSKTLIFGLPDGGIEGDFAECIRLAEEFGRAGGFQKIIGPINGNTWNSYRFCTSNFEPVFFTDLVGNESYVQDLNQMSFTPTWNYVSGKLQSHKVKTPFITNRAFFEREINIEFVSPAALTSYLPAMYPVVSEIFSGNVLFSPISEESFIKKYSAIGAVLKSNDLFLAKHHERIVGFGLVYDDAHNKQQKGMIVKTIGRVKDRKYAGVGAWISEIIYNRFVKENYDYMIHAFMHVGNNSLKISRMYQGEIIKNYAVYEKNF